MTALLSLASRICSHRFDTPAVVIEQQLLDLGFTHITFPNHGPIRARYLNVEYTLE